MNVACSSEVQLSLFDTRLDQQPIEREEPEPLTLRTELNNFIEALVRRRLLSVTTAESRSRLLAAMVRSSGVGTVRALVSDGRLIVDAIRSARHEGTRQTRHLIVQDYLDLSIVELGETVVQASRNAIQESFPGRTHPRPDLVDRQLGGSVKEVRRRPPLNWLDGDRLIEAARSTKEQGHPLRDAAPDGVGWRDTTLHGRRRGTGVRACHSQ